MSSFLQELPKLDKKLLHLLTEHLPDMLWIKDINGTYIYANKAICDNLLMAKDIAEPIGKNDVFFAKREREAHKDKPNWHTFGELCFNSDQVVIDSNKPMKFEEWGNVKGELLYLEVNKAPFYDEEGNIIGTVGAGRDITKLKLTQFELSKQAQIIEQIHDSIITTDLKGNILSWNKSSERLFSYEFQEIKNKNISSIIDSDELDVINNIDIKRLEDTLFRKKMKFNTKKDEKLICEVSLSLLKEDDGRTDRIIYYIKDITQIEHLTKELKLQEQIINIQAQHASMGEMIGNIAHQWRQPLSAISAAATGIKIQNSLGNLENRTLKSSLNSINTQVQYLSKTIDIFRDFIKNEKIYKKDILQNKIDKTLEILESTLENNFITLINEVNYNEPIEIKLISGQLSQVIINIIQNSKDILVEKRVANPWIKITLDKIDNIALITIEDNGGGIPENIINRVFEPYFTTKFESKGTGIGLYMSYKIVVESFKGKLYVKNSENGAKFYVELPLNRF